MDTLNGETALIRDAVKQMEMAFTEFRKGSEDEWPALENLKRVLVRFEALIERKSTAPHNVMRFDVCMAHVYPMIEEGLDIGELTKKVQGAIIETVNKETEWRPDCVFVKSTGGNGNNEKPLYDAEITYDYS